MTPSTWRGHANAGLRRKSGVKPPGGRHDMARADPRVIDFTDFVLVPKFNALPHPTAVKGPTTFTVEDGKLSFCGRLRFRGLALLLVPAACWLT